MLVGNLGPQPHQRSEARGSTFYPGWCGCMTALHHEKETFMQKRGGTVQAEGCAQEPCGKKDSQQDLGREWENAGGEGGEEMGEGQCKVTEMF